MKAIIFSKNEGHARASFTGSIAKKLIMEFASSHDFTLRENCSYEHTGDGYNCKFKLADNEIMINIFPNDLIVFEK